MPFPGKQEDPNDPFDPLGDDGMEGDEYQSYHGCGIPGCDCMAYERDKCIEYEDDENDD